MSDLRELFIRIDSATSLVAYRHPLALSDDLRRELLDLSSAARTLAELLDNRETLAVALAQHWWPQRYVGDITEAEWGSVYDAIHRVAA